MQLNIATYVTRARYDLGPIPAYVYVNTKLRGNFQCHVACAILIHSFKYNACIYIYLILII
jgi:hypothetical protein